jgi:hypothetical protein
MWANKLYQPILNVYVCNTISTSLNVTKTTHHALIIIRRTVALREWVEYGAWWGRASK